MKNIFFLKKIVSILLLVKLLVSRKKTLDPEVHYDTHSLQGSWALHRNREDVFLIHSAEFYQKKYWSKTIIHVKNTIDKENGGIEKTYKCSAV